MSVCSCFHGESIFSVHSFVSRQKESEIVCYVLEYEHSISKIAFTALEWCEMVMVESGSSFGQCNTNWTGWVRFVCSEKWKKNRHMTQRKYLDIMIYFVYIKWMSKLNSPQKLLPAECWYNERMDPRDEIVCMAVKSAEYELIKWT